MEYRRKHPGADGIVLGRVESIGLPYAKEPVIKGHYAKIRGDPTPPGGVRYGIVQISKIFACGGQNHMLFSHKMPEIPVFFACGAFPFQDI